ncbi:MAG: hypothetical protein PWP04_747 [Candidatus Atribacteria bacterium]|nr:hypothetical protein [Candidatus Atribacteria bacterium]
MEYIELFGAQVPRIGLGTWDLKGENCKTAVTNALSLGYRHIDTAEFYYNEEAVGEGILASSVARSEIFLTTKVWPTHLAYSQVINSLNQSLQKLKTDYVDLFLIHWPSDTVPLEETIQAMEDLHHQGKTRFIGVSNFKPALLDKARRISSLPILTDQVEYHPYLEQSKLLQYCQKNQVILTAYCPLGRGRVIGDKVLEKIGQKYGKNSAQVALRWLMEQELVVAIPKAASTSHQKENLEVFDFQLTPEEIAEINQLKRGLRVASQP